MGGGEILIAGLGPAGATLALELASRGFKVKGFDIAPTYKKACGNTTPREGAAGVLAEYFNAVVEEVSEFEILANNRKIKEFSSRKPLWLVLDKGEFIARLREAAEAEGAELHTEAPPRTPEDPRISRLVVDARGPYAHNSYIIVYRVIARTSRWDSSRALIDFQVDRGGLYWIFPAGHNLINAGAGFVRSPPIRDLRGMLLSYLKSRVGLRFDVVVEGAAPLAITVHPKLYDSKHVYVGEAAGLVNALSGEGIRQAIISAQRLSEAVELCGLHIECSKKRYRTYARILEVEARVSRTLLGLILKASPSRGVRLLESLSEGFWLDFLSGRTMRALAKAFTHPSPLTRILGLVASSLRGSLTRSPLSSQA